MNKSSFENEFDDWNMLELKFKNVMTKMKTYYKARNSKPIF